MKMKGSKCSHFSVAKNLNLTSEGVFSVLKSVEMCDMTAGNFECRELGVFHQKKLFICWPPVSQYKLAALRKAFYLATFFSI